LSVHCLQLPIVIVVMSLLLITLDLDLTELTNVTACMALRTTLQKVKTTCTRKI